MGPLWIANLAVIAMSSVIFVIIVISYLKSYYKIKSKALGGIIIFSSIFFVYTVVSFVIYYNMALKYSSSLAELLLLLNSMAFCGYIFVLKVLNI
ncbi:hypothetical protein [Caldiplasma sukawensis]